MDKLQTATIEISSVGPEGQKHVITKRVNVRGMPIYGQGDTREPDRVRFCGLTVDLPDNTQGHQTQIMVITDWGFNTRIGEHVAVPMWGRIEIWAD